MSRNIKFLEHKRIAESCNSLFRKIVRIFLHPKNPNKKRKVFLIEHLEPTLGKWALIEYKNISKIVGKENLWFTNIKRRSKNSEELKKYARVVRESVRNLGLKNACVLDPQSPKLLTPREAKSFEYFIFGGILGDYPPRKRTKVELTQFLPQYEQRNIGKKQFSTDNAVYVVKQIVLGNAMHDLKFKNKITIKINDVESVDLPYLYPLINGKPQISEDLVKLLKRKRGF